MTRFLKLAAACVLLAALYWYCDWRRVGTALARLDAFYLSLAFLLFVPQTIVSALRWRTMTAPLCRISLVESVRQVLSASAWNLVAPSKLGDLSKAAMLPLPPSDRRKAWMLVVVEKLVDVAALALLWSAACLAMRGWLWLTTAMVVAALGAIATRRSLPRVAIGTVGTSLLLWLLHLAQIHLMLLAAGVSVDYLVSLARVPAAIFTGLLPISFCGIGTRDGALVWLFADVASSSTMAAVGLLTATRYIVPGVAGIVVNSLRELTALPSNVSLAAADD